MTDNPEVYSRHLAPEIAAAFRDTPVIFLSGARQTGKTTLARQIRLKTGRLRYLTLDDDAVLSAARSSPSGFIAGLDGPVILDEVQRAPDLFLAIKAAVDRARRPGQFLLTGSADILLLPKVAESLAGRMETFTLWPLSQGEISGTPENFLDSLFRKSPLRTVPQPSGTPALIDRLTRGGYPLVQHRSEKRRRAWFQAYVTSIVQRDIRDLANIEDLAALPRLIALLASRTANLVNFTEMSRSIGLPLTTLKRYFVLLETTFLVTVVNPWSANLGKRLVKTPKVYLNDTGLAAGILGIDRARLSSDRNLIGPLLENFVMMELRKQAGWSRTRPHLLHFRSHSGDEVDLVLEAPSGEIVGVEIKAGSSVGAGDFRGLRTMADFCGPKFIRGVVLYSGSEVVPFDKNLHAVPLHALWQ